MCNTALPEPQPLVFDEDPQVVMWICASCSQIYLEYQEAVDCCKPAP